MRQNLKLKIAAVATFVGAILAMICTLVACSGGSEEQGRIRVTRAQVAGIYQLGAERLELKPDGTYIQDSSSDSLPIHHIGQWRVVDHLFSSSEVLLINAAINPVPTPDDKNPRLTFGDLPMHVHNRSGKPVLARNEVAEAYYERLP